MSVEGTTDEAHCQEPCPDANQGLTIRVPGFSDSASCQNCSPGYGKSTLAPGCTICPAGMYKSDSETKCTSCSSTNANNPLSFPGTTASNKCYQKCSNPGEGRNSAGNCEKCPAGQIQVSTGTGCKICEPGTYRVLFFKSILI